MLVRALVIGLLVFVSLRLHMISLELNWLRRYMVRLLTDQSQAAASVWRPSSSNDAAENAAAVEAVSPPEQEQHEANGRGPEEGESEGESEEDEAEGREEELEEGDENDDVELKSQGSDNDDDSIRIEEVS